MKTFKKFAATRTDASTLSLEAPIVLTPDQIASIAAGSGQTTVPREAVLLRGLTFDPAAMTASDTGKQ